MVIILLYKCKFVFVDLKLMLTELSFLDDEMFILTYKLFN
jgi:hypothetical protein